MLVKFLPTYTGGGLGSINYLLNERRKAAGTAKVVKGDENLTRAIIKGIDFKQKTCFGVLSFEEKHDFLDEEQKLKIIKDFERALLGDYMLDRVNVLWVEHSDKNGRLELNFLIPKIDLVTGKSFNSYLAKFDQRRIDLIKRMINDEYSLSSPDDPAREQTISASKKNIGHYQNLEELDKKLHDLVKEGYIKNRDHIIELLNQSGIEVTRSTKKSITVMLPNQKTKNRLKGGIYDANFTGAQGLGELSQSSSRRIREFHNRDIQAECERNRRKLEELVEKRDRFNKRKFRASLSRDNIEPEQEQKMDIGTHSYDSADDRNGGGLDGSRSEAKFGNGLVGAQRLETRTAQRGRDSDALLHSNPSEQGDLRAKRQILHTYENGIEDDDIRRSIARRKRELDADDQERKERTRIAEEDLDRKIRERGNELQQDKMNLIDRMQHLMNDCENKIHESSQAQKERYEKSLESLRKKLISLQEELQNLRVKYDALQMDYEKLKKDVENL
ncbi:MAG: mobilization protein [Campylobacter sp.]|nr:MAG: mobilization protein [Campylobacter sp.]